jgi:hypothetical protein
MLAAYHRDMSVSPDQVASGPGTLAAALHTTGPDPDHAGQLHLFGRFVGAWDVEWQGTDSQGHPATMLGELHFGWVLGGRAVQDVWKVPASLPAPSGLRPFHGTTLRFYDPAIGAWRSTWIDPLNGRVRRFIGRPDGDDIILAGLEEEPPERWCFRDITQDSFRWTGEVSHDGRQSWLMEEQMLIRRQKDPAGQ